MKRTNGTANPVRLKPSKHNARVHSIEQIQQIADSITRFGWGRPIIIDETDTVLAGHGARLAAIELELTKVPTLKIDGLSEDEKRAFIIMDNKLSLNSTWNDDLLALQINDLVGLGLGDILGFRDEEIKILNLEREHGENNPNAEWTGMPEFTQKSAGAFRSFPVHFKDQAAVDKFAKMIGQPISDATRYVWFPEIEIGHAANQEYQDEK
jgi:hypothetical protein